MSACKSLDPLASTYPDQDRGFALRVLCCVKYLSGNVNIQKEAIFSAFGVEVYRRCRRVPHISLPRTERERLSIGVETDRLECGCLPCWHALWADPGLRPVLDIFSINKWRQRGSESKFPGRWLRISDVGELQDIGRIVVRNGLV